MKKLLIILFLLLPVQAHGADSIAKKLVTVDWIKEKALKYGFLYSLSASQFLTGATEGYHFNGNSGYLVQESNYHVYATGRRVGWVTTGFFAQANLRDKNQTLFTKGRRLVGGILISRIFFEGAYRWQRYNNPFCSDPDKNKHAVVYFGIRNGRITDLYLGTGTVTTPLADALILLAGLWIFD